MGGDEENIMTPPCSTAPTAADVRASLNALLDDLGDLDDDLL